MANVADRTDARDRRPRLVAQIEARAEIHLVRDPAETNEAAQRELARWLADLDTYPRAFREQLRAEVCGSFARVPRSRWSIPMEVQRGRDGGFDCRLLEGQLSAYRSTLQARRQAQATGDRRKIRRAQKGVDHYRRGLLMVLWKQGRRQILRSDFLAYVENEVVREWRMYDSYATALPVDIASLRKRLSGGVATAGPRRGAPHSPRYRAQLERDLARCESSLEHTKQRLAEFDAEPDPMRLAGIWPRRRRPS